MPIATPEEEKLFDEAIYDEIRAQQEAAKRQTAYEETLQQSVEKGQHEIGLEEQLRLKTEQKKIAILASQKAARTAQEQEQIERRATEAAEIATGEAISVGGRAVKPMEIAGSVARKVGEAVSSTPLGKISPYTDIKSQAYYNDFKKEYSNVIALFDKGKGTNADAELLNTIKKQSESTGVSKDLYEQTVKLRNKLDGGKFQAMLKKDPDSGKLDIAREKLRGPAFRRAMYSASPFMRMAESEARPMRPGEFYNPEKFISETERIAEYGGAGSGVPGLARMGRLAIPDISTFTSVKPATMSQFGGSVRHIVSPKAKIPGIREVMGL